MSKPHDKWASLLRNTISASLSLGFSLVVAEYTYAYFEPPQQKDRADISLHPFVEFNPDLGWQGKPNSSGRFNVLGVSTQVSLNAQGMRYHDIGPRKAYRVAIQGDSIVWGYGVTQQDRFTEQTETILPDVEVLNYGEVGYGPVQYLLQLDKIIERSTRGNPAFSEPPQRKYKDDDDWDDDDRYKVRHDKYGRPYKKSKTKSLLGEIFDF